MRFEEGFSQVDDGVDIAIAEQLVEAFTECRAKSRIHELQGPGNPLTPGGPLPVAP